MNDIRNDKNLQEAVNRREQRLEPMPADLNDRLMESLTQRPLQREKGLKRKWIYGAVAIAAGIALLVLFNFSQTSSDEASLLAQQTQAIPSPVLSEPVIEEPQPEMVDNEQPMMQQPVMPQPVIEQGEPDPDPQETAPTPTDKVEQPRHYTPQAIPDIASPRDEQFLASTSHMVVKRSHHHGLTTYTNYNDSKDDGLNLTATKDKDEVPEGWKDLKSWSNKQSKRGDLTKKERKQMAVLGAIGDKRWHIDITSMNTMRYGSRTVTSDFFLELRGDTLRSYLPYLGQAHASPSLSPTIGLNFEERVRQYQESRPKGKYTQIDIDVKTKEDTYHYVIDIYDSGDAYIRVRSLNRDPIGFDGTLETKY
ncbi:DUF4251 domain-containing protein [Prevotella sp. E2-28]|uniref:DUF4251 domain-containing protein n=1 Tax=Prevotella sp. E2-28 TaxID=2913620 RepID=UPI001EDAFB16|nr:DUF4251 domain-containing protein [Prevotella sp. E2-28]UKK54335.1 DUF4251 domain-containing protein [Prevotella sp. E2-28]